MRYNPISGRFELPAGSASVDGTAINPSSIGATTPGLVYATEFRFDANTKIYPRATGYFTFSKVGDGAVFELAGPDAQLKSDGSLGWSGSTIGQASTLVLFQDAANTLAQRNGTNAQESRLYGTYTTSTVYERLSSKYDSGSGAFVIGTEKGASGGANRPLYLQSSSGLVVVNAADLTVFGSFQATGDITIGASKEIRASGYSAFSIINPDGVITTKTLKTTPVLFSALPAAATIGDGARAFITDGASAYPANIGGTASGGGANPTPVMTIGGAWIYG